MKEENEVECLIAGLAWVALLVGYERTAPICRIPFASQTHSVCSTHFICLQLHFTHAHSLPPFSFGAQPKKKRKEEGGAKNK